VLVGPAQALEVQALRVGDRPTQPELQQLGVAADGVERGPQLVAHGREELALRPVRGLRLGPRRLGRRARGVLRLEEPRPLQRLRGLPGERLQERDLVGEGARRREAQAERADHAPGGVDDGHGAQRLRAVVAAEIGDGGRVRRDGVERGQHDRAPRARRLRQRHGRVERERRPRVPRVVAESLGRRHGQAVARGRHEGEHAEVGAEGGTDPFDDHRGHLLARERLRERGR
jgi:hypothetical protein